MDSKYILVALIIILFIVNIAFIFYMSSQITTLSSDYSTATTEYNNLRSIYSSLYANYSDLVSKYNSLASSFNTLYMNYTKLSAEYSTLSSEYSNLTSNYVSLSNAYSELQGKMTVLDFFLSVADANTGKIENLITGPMPVTFQITSPPGNGTVILTPSNYTLGIGEIGSMLSKYFGYPEVRSYYKSIIIHQFGNYTLGEGVIAFKNVNQNGTSVDTYALIYVLAMNTGKYQWQIVNVKIDNSISIYQYNMITTALSLIQDLVTKNLAGLQSILVGPFPSYVYIASGPFMGNYTGGDIVTNIFIDTIVAKNISTISFEPFYMTLNYTSNQTGIVNVYGNLTITLSNGTTMSYYTQLEMAEQLEPDGLFQVYGFNILNDLTLTEIENIIPK
ncbi:hypothetical protein [Stygiolobus azoricus]|uniref:Uncharacterized protein n=1 Tax=Stygiolobus azoricus TaxID=41675 RepID=A0A650CRL7_9CREN|nr:hypothetical protein [Stygiolobus azoricus]QGR20418.1 hypothetical protein D1868_10770 [Stygiolobus azoricus]